VERGRLYYCNDTYAKGDYVTVFSELTKQEYFGTMHMLSAAEVIVRLSDGTKARVPLQHLRHGRVSLYKATPSGSPVMAASAASAASAAAAAAAPSGAGGDGGARRRAGSGGAPAPAPPAPRGGGGGGGGGGVRRAHPAAAARGRRRPRRPHAPSAASRLPPWAWRLRR